MLIYSTSPCWYKLDLHGGLCWCFTVNFLFRAADYVSVTVLNTCCRQFGVNGPHVSLLTSVTSTAFSDSRIKRQRGGDLHIFFPPAQFSTLGEVSTRPLSRNPDSIRRVYDRVNHCDVLNKLSYGLLFQGRDPRTLQLSRRIHLEKLQSEMLSGGPIRGNGGEGGDNWGQGFKSMKIRKLLPPCAHFRPHSRHSSDGSFYLFYFFIFRSSCISCGTTFMIRCITVEFKGH